jgi:hypothetical protein
MRNQTLSQMIKLKSLELKIEFFLLSNIEIHIVIKNGI